MSSAQWANIGDDPGAVHALIERIPEHAPVAAIDYLWLFPSRRIAIGESIVVVIGAFDEDPERRRVSTAHFTVARNRKGAATVKASFDEHGSAPVSAIPRIVQGVLRRLGEDTEASPREEQIGGDQDRWDALIVELGGSPRIDAPEGDPDEPETLMDPHVADAVSTPDAVSASDTTDAADAADGPRPADSSDPTPSDAADQHVDAPGLRSSSR